MLDENYVISYVLYLSITGIVSYGTTLLKKMKEYNHSKEVAQDIVYKVEQLGKELVWDAVTKHAKAAEEIAGKCTGLSDEDIYNIIKTTVGMFNVNKI
jgi:hypothetical protein